MRPPMPGPAAMNKQRAAVPRARTLDTTAARAARTTIDHTRRRDVRAGLQPTEPVPPHTVDEAAERLDCSVATVRRRIDAGDLVAIKHGRVLRILESDLQAFIRASRRWRT
jgi:excisionase family DNA binding protein